MSDTPTERYGVREGRALRRRPGTKLLGSRHSFVTVSDTVTEVFDPSLGVGREPLCEKPQPERVAVVDPEVAALEQLKACLDAELG